jgi:hypothetical protein
MATLLLSDLAPRDHYWEECRNGLGIARLLLKEKRSEALIGTACRTAIENACRASLLQSGRAFDGDVNGALCVLEAPPEVRLPTRPMPGEECLEAAERVVAWLASYLKTEAPGRCWGY